VTEAELILAARAKQLARTAPAPSTEASLELLEFRLAQERYAIETRFVQEVYPLRELTPLPCTPPFIRGVVNVRGRIVPVLDLKKFFALPDQGLTDLHRVILLRGHGLEIGLLADIALGVRTVLQGALQPSLPTLTGIRADYLKGVIDGPLIVLDADRLLADPNIIVREDVEA
jgi:purine-binding chemotaxis protein CheW